MSLYDDFDVLKQKSEEVAGWSSGIKLFQTQVQLKKATTAQSKREIRRVGSILAPVFDLNSKKDDDEIDISGESIMKERGSPYASNDIDWVCEEAEYDPLWPNDYEKVVKDLRELKEKEKEREDNERLKRREERWRMERKESRFEPREEEKEEMEPLEKVPTPTSPSPAARGGVAIAPPPSLQEQVIPKAYGASVAAKIMAKYGFKEGQGLGKQEQGISMALQVEKTSKRGGRIIHEKDLPAAPSFNAMPPPPTPEPEFVEPMPPPKPPSPKNDVSITEIMKSPSKVVLLKNMVGPGEVDSELEPEVREECHTKYGDVIKVLIHELPNAEPEEAVRIFVEFKRIESAIKAVVDLNGRFFGGRQVKAGFYSQEKFLNFQLLE